MKQTKICTNLCIGNLLVVLHSSQCFFIFVLRGFHCCNAWLYLQPWTEDLRSRVAWFTGDCKWLPVVFTVIMVISSASNV